MIIYELYFYKLVAYEYPKIVRASPNFGDGDRRFDFQIKMSNYIRKIKSFLSRNLVHLRKSHADSVSPTGIIITTLSTLIWERLV